MRPFVESGSERNGDGDTRVIHQDVDASELIYDVVEQTNALAGLDQIRLKESDPSWDSEASASARSRFRK